MSGRRRPNAHGRVALQAAEQRARVATKRRVAAAGLDRIGAELAARRERAEAATRLGAVLAHLHGPRLLRRNEGVRLDGLLAGTNESASEYEVWR